MPYKAIVFDLYGTLVDNFSSHAYDHVQEQMAKVLDIPYPQFRQIMLETINDKSADGYYAVEDNILAICRCLSIKVDTADVYDSHRPEVENWQGIAIDEITELCDIVSELA